LQIGVNVEVDAALDALGNCRGRKLEQHLEEFGLVLFCPRKQKLLPTQVFKHHPHQSIEGVLLGEAFL
jgi:hypothetical protein